MESKFSFDQLVRVKSQPDRIKPSIIGRIGTVTGMSDPYENGKRDFGVFIDELQEMFAIPQDNLELLGSSSTAPLS